MRSFSGIELAIVGFIVLILILIIAGGRRNKVRPTSTPTMIITPPDNSKMVCRTCGAVLSAENTSLIQGTEMIVCPKCNNIYQMVEKSK